jgi:uncharacterized protein (DUF1015 family)
MRVFPISTLLPEKNRAQRVASLGSGKLSADVLQSKAQALEDSYLRVVKPQFVDASLISETQEFYDKSRQNLIHLIKTGCLKTHPKNMFLYEQHHHSGIKLSGWIIGVDAEDYINGKIKKHENTLTSKENRLVRHIAALESMAEPVLLSQKLPDTLKLLAEEIIQSEADLQVSDELYNIHRVWKLRTDEDIKTVQDAFENVDSLYIADGHHRCAASSRYLIERYGSNSGKGIMALVMDDEDLLVKPFYRMLSNIDPKVLWDFLDSQKIHHWEVAHSLNYEDLKKGQILCITRDIRCVIEISPQMQGESALSQLDVRVLETEILRKTFDLKDSSNEDRLSFMRGDTPLDSIAQKLFNKEIDIAFLFAPNSMSEIRMVADQGDTMPAKSTFIEPKIPTGLIIEDYR